MSKLTDRDVRALRFGCVVEQDTDDDWIIIPPEDVVIFFSPGEPVLLKAETYDEAIAEAIEYLADFPELPADAARAKGGDADG